MSLDPQDVCAIILTKGEGPAWEIGRDLPYGEVLLRFPNRTERLLPDGSTEIVVQHADSKVFGRYHAAAQTHRPVVYFQDDDIVFTAHEELLAAYEPGKLISNMGRDWIEAQAYHDLALVGLGSLIDRDLPARTLARYLAAYGKDDRFLLDADFAHGVLTPFKRVDLGAEILPLATAPDRLSMQPGQMEGKWRTIRKARELRRVVLTILAKNEAENITRALDSARELIDHVLVIDTGSTDGTPDVVQGWARRHSMPVNIIERPFVDFATNRNELLEEGRKLGDYMLLMDADEELIDVPPSGWEHLLAHAYFMHYAGNIDYAQPRLLFSQFPWYFDGEAHAALDADEPAACVDLRAPKILHHGDGRHGTEKLTRDIELLTAAIERGEEVPRNLFLRGKAYEGLSRWDDAAADYEVRIELSCGDEEAYYSRFRLGVIEVERRGNLANGADHLMTAYLERPTRVESIRALAHYLTAVADATPYPLGDKIIVHRDLYTEQD